MSKTVPSSNLIGQRYGKLTIIERAGVPGRPLWLCRCDCGKERTARIGNLNDGVVDDCGGHRKEKAAIRRGSSGVRG